MAYPFLPHHHALSYTGKQHYFLTFCTDQRRKRFIDSEVVNRVKVQFVRAAHERHFEITAYCFMPDHVHQLIKGTTLSADGRQYMRLAKQYSGYYYSQTFKQRLWQRYGHDRFLRKDQDVRTMVRYVIENPVRRRIVGRVEDYPFTGSQSLSIQELMEWAYTD